MYNITGGPLNGLTHFNQFIIYKLKPKADGKFDKIPWNPSTLKPYSALDPANWTSHEEAHGIASLFGESYGVGFVLTELAPFFCIDIDDCINAGGQYNDIATRLCNAHRGAAVEISQSGKGLHIWGAYDGSEPDHSCKNTSLKIELYTSKRFIALTGNCREGDANVDQTMELQQTIDQFFPPEASTTKLVQSPACSNHDDEELISKILNQTGSPASVFGGRASISDLWNNIETKLSKFYPPQKPTDPYDRSSADMALANHLAYDCGGNADQVTRLMWESGLKREKWTKNTNYLATTVGKAIADLNHSDLISQGGGIDDVVIRLALKIKQSTNSEININSQVITEMIAGAFWSGQQLKMYILTNNESLNLYTASDAFKFLKETFGCIVDDVILEKVAINNAEKDGLNKAETKKYITDTLAAPGRIIVDHLKHYNQRHSIEMRVDMFSDKGRIEIRDEKARIIYAHSRFVASKPSYRKDVVEDYKIHFPEFDDLIKFLVAARFARDRKTAYMWFHCDSGWGKGLLISILDSFGASIELSVKEIEAIFEGKPVGRSMNDFKRTIAIIVDEFKTVKSELKQLQNEITLSPKHQLSVKVEVFSKLFFSAEGVPSLAGDYGVEDQFANRLSFYRGKGCINGRLLFKDIGNACYFDHIQSYTAELLNDEIERYVEMGRCDAERAGDDYLEKFHQAHGIENYHNRYSTSLSELAEDFKSWLIEMYNHDPQGGRHCSSIHEQVKRAVFKCNGHWYFKSPSKIFGQWADEVICRSEITSILRKKDEIYRKMSESSDGKGYDAHNISGKTVRCIKL